MKNIIFRVFFALVLVLSFSLVTATPAAAVPVNYYVTTGGSDSADGSSGTPWLTIQYAIDNVVATDIINVAAGTYTEDLTIPSGATSLELVGAGLATTTIKGVSTTDGDAALLIEASGVKIHGFTIESTDGSVSGTNYGVFVANVNVEIYDNAFLATISGAGTMTMLVTESVDSGSNDVGGLSIHDNTFTSDATGVSSEGIYINYHTGYQDPPDTVTIANNQFSGNIFRAITTERSKTTISGNTIISAYSPGTNSATEAYRGIDIVSMSGGSHLNPDQDTVAVTNNNVTAFEWGISIGASTREFTDITVTSNTLTGNTIGVKVRDGAGDISLNFNNITGSLTKGVDNTDSGVTLDAENNWWGNASGAGDLVLYDASGHQSYGDNVSTFVDYEPWLLVSGGETYEKTLALKDNWTLVSVDAEVTTGTAWIGTTVLSGSDTILAYKYTAGSGYTQITLATQLTSVDAYYISTDGGGGIGITYSTSSPGVVTKSLLAGWNIISSAAETDAYELLSPLRYAQIGDQEGTGLTSLVGQASYNQYLATTFSTTTVTTTEWNTLESVPVTLNANDGYWVHMNAAKSFGVIPD